MAYGDVTIWVLGEPNLNNEDDDEIIWVLGEPYNVIDSQAAAVAAELGAFYQRRNPMVNINIQTCGQVRAG